MNTRSEIASLKRQLRDARKAVRMLWAMEPRVCTDTVVRVNRANVWSEVSRLAKVRLRP